ncbi:hypothetical protein ACVOMV_00005 [Mesorhizobium atlanticum]
MADAVDKVQNRGSHRKKIRDTIEQGKLPHSRETAIFASFLAILVFAVFYAKDAITGMFLSTFLEKPEAWPMSTATDVISLYRQQSDEGDRSRRRQPAGAPDDCRHRHLDLPELAADRR